MGKDPYTVSMVTHILSLQPISESSMEVCSSLPIFLFASHRIHVLHSPLDCPVVPATTISTSTQLQGPVTPLVRNVVSEELSTTNFRIRSWLKSRLYLCFLKMSYHTHLKIPKMKKEINSPAPQLKNPGLSLSCQNPVYQLQNEGN